jgi:hypothetical protein
MTSHSSVPGGSGKLFFIRANLEDFKEKIGRLQDLADKSFCDEALILCVVYIDYLASGRYFDGNENSRENFCRALRELSGCPFFSAIHPKVLLEEAARCSGQIESFVQSIVRQRPKQFFTPDEVVQKIKASSLPDSAKSSLAANLWRASVAAICYEKIRCHAVHGPGRTIKLTFPETAYNGLVVMAVDFNLLYGALRAIFHEVEVLSLQTGEWFGNPRYI